MILNPKDLAFLILISFLILPQSSFAQIENASATPTPGTTFLNEAQVTTSTPSPSDLKKLSLEQLMNIDVTSVSKQPQPYGQAPAAIDVITNDEIRRSGAIDIPGALRLADNLEVAQTGSNGWNISARGFNTSNNNKLLVLMDGRSLYNPLYGGLRWDMQDYLLADIDRIEVISGPGGTLWGANAVNGVINITSKNAKDTQGVYVETGGGTELQDFVAARFGGSLGGDVYYRVYGKYFEQAAENYADDGTGANDSSNHGQAGFRMDAKANDDVFTMQGDLFNENGSENLSGEGTPLAQPNSNEGNLLMRWSRTFSSDSDMSLQVYYDHVHLLVPATGVQAFGPVTSGGVTLFPATAAIPQGNLIDDEDTVDLEYQYRHPIGTWNHVVWGFSYRYTQDMDEGAPVIVFLPSPYDLQVISCFAQDEVQLLNDFSLTLGSKIENNSFTQFEFEPSGKLQWNLSDNQMLWGAVSRAVRMPTLYERDLDLPSPGHPLSEQLIGNSNFISEDVIAYELGYRVQVDQDLSGSLSTFYNVYSNVRSESTSITFGDPASLEQLYITNNDSATTGGVEFNFDYQALSWWRLHAGYDLLVEYMTVGPRGDVTNGLADTADPPNQVFLRSSMDLPGQTELDAAFRWIDAVQTYNGSTPATVPAYAEMDARLGWHVTPALELSVVGQNLLHDEHVEAGVPGTSQEEIGRSVYGEVACSF